MLPEIEEALNTAMIGLKADIKYWIEKAECYKQTIDAMSQRLDVAEHDLKAALLREAALLKRLKGKKNGK